jgi:hypothetical protein
MIPGLADFQGDWVFTRLVADPNGTPTARVEGIVSFRRGEGGLVAEERGRMRLEDGPELAAERRTIWRQDGRLIRVFFGDGRPFHHFDPAGATEAEHVCTPDLYRVAYDFGRFPNWRSVWRVTGPRKDYVMTTDHRRNAALV